MVKNILVIVLVISIFTQVDVIAAQEMYTCKNEEVLESLMPVLFEKESSKISRGCCIMVLMKILGVDNVTAAWYANADYYVPVFSDLEYDDVNAGYIIVSKFGGVSVGIQKNEYDPIHAFYSKRDVTNRECLTFMLRCLKNADLVNWDTVMEDSVQIGLLQENELGSFVADAPLLNKDFYTLLSRMLNMNRYLYWPTEELQAGHAKSMKIDTSGSIKYIDWLDKKN